MIQKLSPQLGAPRRVIPEKSSMTFGAHRRLDRHGGLGQLVQRLGTATPCFSKRSAR